MSDTIIIVNRLFVYRINSNEEERQTDISKLFFPRLLLSAFRFLHLHGLLALLESSRHSRL